MIGTAQVCSEDSMTPTRPSTGESPKGCARPSSATAFLDRQELCGGHPPPPFSSRVALAPARQEPAVTFYPREGH